MLHEWNEGRQEGSDINSKEKHSVSTKSRSGQTTECKYQDYINYYNSDINIKILVLKKFIVCFNNGVAPCGILKS